MSSQEPLPPPTAPSKRNYVGWLVMLVVLLGGTLYGLHLYRISFTREVTDNAQVDANITAVSARVRGQVLEVKVKDNDLVRQGDVLFTLDPADLQTRVDQAESALAAARQALAQARLQVALTERRSAAQVDERRSSITVSEQQVASASQAVAVAQAEADRTEADIAGARSRISQAQAEVKAAQAQLQRAEAEMARLRQDRSRYESLFRKREVSQQQYEATATAARQAEAQVEAARQNVAAAQAAVGAAEAALANAQAGRQVALQAVGRAEATQAEMQARVGEAQGRLEAAEAQTLETGVAKAAVDARKAEVARAEANLAQARLELSYTTVKAPCNGRVTRKNVDPGQYVDVGTPAMALVDESDMWVVANFKETQMAKMKVGQRVTIKVDTYPEQPLEGQVESIQAGTGSVFSLLPPENASGSFVKVVQRIPVKISLSPQEQSRLALRPGMSVEATVWLE